MQHLNHRPLSEINMPFSKVPTYGQRYLWQSGYKNDGGLYFVGMMTVDPEENHYYLVKIGKSKDVHKRLKQYFGYNPMIYNNNNILYIPNELERDIAEENCHAFISHYAYGVAAGGIEWYYVTKEIYFFLCDIFNDTEMFKFIANGEIGVD